ncbi:unnamed protein product [Timema podura]|uniref:Uncharacterized protein n=1 Tax=Timema podura TaxID=61482 RepID=A0ABN7P0S5_TIMPD|nr:unnamed protein product [Timema podura]
MAARSNSIIGKLRGLSAPWTVRRLSSSLGPLQYPELDEKIMAARQKDMPVSDMPNPFEREKAQCVLCRLKLTPDYKNAKLLSQFVSPYTGRIYGRHITGLCLRQQQLVEEENYQVSKWFMAYYLKQVEFLHDPKLFDPERPIRNHRAYFVPIVTYAAETWTLNVRETRTMTMLAVTRRNRSTGDSRGSKTEIVWTCNEDGKEENTKENDVDEVYRKEMGGADSSKC